MLHYWKISITVLVQSKILSTLSTLPNSERLWYWWYCHQQYVLLYVFVCTKTIQPKISTEGRHHHHNLPLDKINNHVSNGSILACCILKRPNNELWPRKKFHFCNVQLQPGYFEWWAFRSIAMTCIVCKNIKQQKEQYLGFHHGEPPYY